MSRPQRVVAVPVDLALVYDPAGGWRYEQAPPAWCLEQANELLFEDLEFDDDSWCRTGLALEILGGSGS